MPKRKHFPPWEVFSSVFTLQRFVLGSINDATEAFAVLCPFSLYCSVNNVHLFLVGIIIIIIFQAWGTSLSQQLALVAKERGQD